MGEFVEQVARLVLCVLLGLYVYLLGARVTPVYAAELADTITPLYTVGESLQAIEDEGGRDDGELDEFPRLVSDEQSEDEALRELPTLGESEGAEGPVSLEGEPTVGESGGVTLGESEDLTLGASGPPATAASLDYTRYIPAAIAVLICYKVGQYIYRFCR